MISTRRVLLAGLVLPVLGALVGGTAQAQDPAPYTLDPGASFEGYYTHFRLDARGGDWKSANGFGGRLMWHPGGRETRASWLAPRIGLGAFAEYAPEQDPGFTLLHAGVQGDLSLVDTPLFGRVEPMLGLGVGALRTSGIDLFTEREIQSPAALSIVGMPSLQAAADDDRAVTTLALSPAFGARVNLVRNLSARADVRDLVTFRDGPKHNLQLAAGLSLPF
jgi:hypothetical protein